MERPIKLSLKEEVEQDLKQMETEAASHPGAERIHVKAEVDDALMEKIHHYEETGTHSRRAKKKNLRWAAALVAVLVLLFAIGMTSVGSKSYWKEMLNILMGENGSAEILNVEDMDRQSTEDLDEMKIYRDIDKRLHADLVWARYMPRGMVIEEYSVDENLKLARLYYSYEGNTIRYTIYASREDSSWTEKEEDESANRHTRTVNGVEMEIEEIVRPGEQETTRVVRFEYKGIHYEWKGVLEDAELEQMLESLYFL